MPRRFEIRKDQAQEAVETAATRVGNVTRIVTGAIRDVAHEIGEWTTDVIEMREAGRRAAADQDVEAPPDVRVATRSGAGTEPIARDEPSGPGAEPIEPPRG